MHLSIKRRRAEKDVLLLDLMDWFREELHFGAYTPRLEETYTRFRERIFQALNEPSVADANYFREKLKQLSGEG
jgi:hypothetical protein